MSHLATTGTVIGKTHYRSASKISLIRDKLQGYVNSVGEGSGTAVISELVQNADDAHAEHIVFRFFPGYLEAYNDSFFQKKDFKNITELMAAGKAEEAGKIGAFGTGFISVYHLTDTPHLQSSGKHIVFDPTRDELDILASPVNRETLFQFPWRRERTTIGKALGAKVWSEQSIDAVKRNLGPIIYRLALFLRHVRVIDVCDGQNRLLYQVKRQLLDTDVVGEAWRERWSITYTEADANPVTDIWIYYRTSIAESKGLEEITIKDREVSLAFPQTPRRWLTTAIPATLYNFLPTAIKTQLPFQVNGAFFPDNNRRGILIDEVNHPEKTLWNQRVVDALGDLFVAVAEDIRDQAKTPQRFYELLPLDVDEDAFVWPIQEAFLAAADNLECVYSSLQVWRRPADVLVGGIDELIKLAMPYIEVLPPRAPEAMRRLLVKNLGRPPLILSDVLDVLEPHLHSGARLGADISHPMIDSPRKLFQLYTAAEKTLAQAGTNISVHDQLTNRLSDLPIYLAEDGCLYDTSSDDALWCGDDEVRALTLNGVVRFVDRKAQAGHQTFLTDMLQELTGKALLNCVRQMLPAVEFLPKGDQRIPALLNTKEKFGQVLRYIARDIKHITADDLTGLPIILTNAGYLYSTKYLIHWPAETADQQVLTTFQLQFIDAAFAQDDLICSIYKQANLKQITPHYVLLQLEATIKNKLGSAPYGPRESLPSPYSSVAKLREILEYFARRHHITKLDDDDLVRLRKLPFYATTGGTLATANSGDGDMLMLPSGDSHAQHEIPLDVLGMDVLIDPDLLGGNVRDFLHDVLGIEEITPLTALHDHILPHYNDDNLTNEVRLVLLQFIRSLWEDQTQRPQVLAMIRDAVVRVDTALLHYYTPTDEEDYRSNEPIYFDTAETRRLLPYGFARPHPCYEGSEWRAFLRDLGVREHAWPDDLVGAVRQSAREPFEGARLTHLHAVYHALNGHLGEGRRYALTTSTLKELAKLAWIPGLQGETMRLCVPAEICSRAQQRLIGDLMPTLPDGWERTDAELRKLLQMKERPPVERVAEHLLSRTASPDSLPAIVRDLGERWGMLPASLTQHLRREAVIWAQDQYWPANLILMNEQHQAIFGQRRGYWSHALDESTQNFLQAAGATVGPDSWLSHIAFLEEIATEYTDSQPLCAADQALVLANFAALSAPHWNITALEPAIIGQIRAKPIFLCADKHLAAIDDPAMPLKISRGPGASETTIPAVLLGQGGVLADELASAGYGFLTSVLRVDAISPFVVLRDYFALAYTQMSDHEQRCELLAYLAAIWGDLPPNDQKELLQALADCEIVRCTDGHYRRVAEVYFAAAQLDTIFGGVYHHLHPSYHISRVEEDCSDPDAVTMTLYGALFHALGVGLRLRIDDLVQRIRAIVSRGGGVTEEKLQALRPVYLWLRREIGNLDETERGILAQLSSMEWFPAEQNGVARWYRPQVVYRRDRRVIVGDQVPISAFPIEIDPTEALRMFLGMPDEPPADAVATHLLTLQGAAEKPKSLLRIYQFLGKRWESIGTELQERLQIEAVVWDEARPWIPSKVFFVNFDVNYRQLFGARRCYYMPPADADVHAFLQHLGVITREHYHRITHHVELLHEVANDYQTHERPLSTEDRALLHTTFDHLGRVLEGNERQTTLAALSDLPIVPGIDRRLYRPDAIVLVESAQRNLLERFRDANPAVVDSSDGETPGQLVSPEGVLKSSQGRSALSEAGFQCLYDLGVSLLTLGGVVTCQLLRVQDDHEETALSTYLRALDSVFRRIDRTLIGHGVRCTDRAIPLDALRHIAVIACNEMTVRYVLTYPSGRTLESEPSTKEAALFIPSTTNAGPALYVRQRPGKITYIPLARELERLFFPNSGTSSILQQVLQAKTVKIANHLLNQHGYRDDRGDEVSEWENEMAGVELGNVDDSAEQDGSTVRAATNSPPSESATPDTAVAPEASGSATTIMEETTPSTQSSSQESETAAATQGSDTTSEATNGSRAADQHVSSATEQVNGGTTTSQQGKTTSTGHHEPSQKTRSQRGGSNGAAPGASKSKRRSRNTSNGKGRQGEQNGSGDGQSQEHSSDERHDWSPECSPETVLPRVQQHTGQVRTDDFVRGSGRTIGLSATNQDADDDRESTDRLTQAAKNQIGQWGERYTLRCLKHEMQDQFPHAQIGDTRNTGGRIDGFAVRVGGKIVVSARWHNAGGVDSGQGGDITLMKQGVEHIIEVKATIETKKDWFQVSGKQWQVARKYQARYAIYRVTRAGCADATIEVITDPVKRWQEGKLAVDPLRIRL